MRRALALTASLFTLAFASAANAQPRDNVAIPPDRVIEQAQPQRQPAQPVRPPQPVSFGAPFCAIRQFTPAQGWLDRNPRTFADVNGDHRADIVGFKDDGVYVALSNGQNFNASSRWIEDFGWRAGYWSEREHERILADVNNDGKADIVGFGNEGTYVALSTGSSFGPTRLWTADFGQDQGWSRMGMETPVEGNETEVYIAAHHIRTMADVNGDGRADIVGFGNDGVYYALSNGTRFGPTRLAIADYGYNQGYAVYNSPFYAPTGRTFTGILRTTADVNGDGRADIVVSAQDGIYVVASNGNTFAAPRRALNAFGNDLYRANDLRLLADLDGDRKADLAYFDRRIAGAAFGNGNANFTLANMILVGGFGADAGWNSQTTHPRVFADLNADRRADLVAFGNDGVWTALSQGRAPMTSPVLSVAAFGYGEWRLPNMRFTPDINGDNRADIAGFGTDCVVLSINQRPNPDALSGAERDRMGVEQRRGD